jgi:hypothetical protein
MNQLCYIHLLNLYYLASSVEVFIPFLPIYAALKPEVVLNDKDEVFRFDLWATELDLQDGLKCLVG